MKKINYRFFALLLVPLLLITSNATLSAQQIPQFTQYMFNGLYLNPAYAGYKNELYLHGFYRTQWQGLDGGPKLFTFSADASVAKEKVGLGLLVSIDQLGLQQAISFMTDYSYKIRLGDFANLNFGLGLGAVQFSNDGSKANPADPGDVIIPTATFSEWSPEANAGVYLYNDRFYVGVSAMNLISRYVATDSDEEAHVQRAATHLFITGGMMFPVSRNFQLKPSVLLKEDFHSPTSFDWNMMLLMYDRVWFGVSYRMALSLWKDNMPNVGQFQSDAVAFIAEVYATKTLRIGYSYDLDFTKMRGFAGTHEISLGVYITPRMRRMLSPRYF